MDTGNRWSYAFTESTGAAYLSTERVMPEVTLDGRTVHVVHTTNTDTGESLGDTYLEKTASALTIIDPGRGGGFDTVHFPVVMGETFVQTDSKDIDVGADWDADGRNETVSIRNEVTILGLEDVRTDAGRFSQALKLQNLSRQNFRYSKDGRLVPVTVTVLAWFAKDVGRVQQRETRVYINGTETVSSTLSAYRTATRTGELTPPTVVATMPAEDRAQGPFTPIQLTFSERMDASGFTPASLVLLDHDNVPLAGAVRLSDHTVTFTPTVNLLSGSYTLRADASLSDLSGNRLDHAQELHFRIDADAPSILSVTPANAAGLVPANSSVTVEFSEDIDPASVDYWRAKLQAFPAYENGPVVPTTLRVSGRQLTVTPTSPLEYATKYILTLSRINDVNGNSLPDKFQSSFTTDSLLLRPLERISTGAGTDAVAIGDLNGDGLNDIALTTSTWRYSVEDSRDKLMIFLQKADGSLTAPIKIPLKANSSCTSENKALSIANIDNQSRPEIMVGEGGCGIEVFKADGSGNWSRSRVLEGNYGDLVKAADLNGDGRVDLLGAGWGTSEVTIWIQSSGGTLLPPVTYALAHEGYDDLKVGDVSGDGRNDIVMLSGQGDMSKALGILVQQSDGLFSQDPVYPDLGDVYHKSVNIGDFTGDHRNDVLVTLNNSPVGTSIALFAQLAAGGFAPMTVVPVTTTAGNLAMGDLDNDGTDDLLMLSGFGVSLFRQQVAGKPGSPLIIPCVDCPSSDSRNVAIADINNDGVKDAIFGDEKGLGVMYNHPRWAAGQMRFRQGSGKSGRAASSDRAFALPTVDAGTLQP